MDKWKSCHFYKSVSNNSYDLLLLTWGGTPRIPPDAKIIKMYRIPKNLKHEVGFKKLYRLKYIYITVSIY